MSPIRNPGLEEFLRRARLEFGFLTTEFGFEEQTLPTGADVNEYQVRYVNATTLIRVEGINWGYGVNVMLEPKRQSIVRSKTVLPLWSIVKLRRPDLYDALAIGDQLEQLASHAIALRQCAEDVLRGHFDVRAEIERAARAD